VDPLSKEDRSALMRRVRRTDTAPELKLRKALHRQGLRYVVTDKRLPGSPDLVFPRHRVALFVHGCFWHGHDCRRGRAPGSNQDFWLPKLEGNKQRDEKKQRQLQELGWRVITVWECDLEKLNDPSLAVFCSKLKTRIARGR
jgi:DNA mismatch endonuclease, patch repair protein